MIKPITNFNEAIEIYFESGSARLRLKEWVSFESLRKVKIDESRNLFPKDVS